MKIKDYTKECVNFFPNRYSKSTGNRYYPDMIVLHNTGGTNISSAHWWFLDKASQTSAHFLVGLDGEVRQYVDLRNGAFCNGTSTNEESNAFYKKSTSINVKSRDFNANLYTVSIEFVGNVNTELTEAQLQTAVELIRHIQTEVKDIYGKEIKLDRKHIIGHYEVAPETRGYCGKKIQFEKIIERLNEKREHLTVPIPEPAIPSEEVQPEKNPKTTDKPVLKRRGRVFSLIKRIIKQ